MERGWALRLDVVSRIAVLFPESERVADDVFEIGKIAIIPVQPVARLDVRMPIDAVPSRGHVSDFGQNQPCKTVFGGRRCHSSTLSVVAVRLHTFSVIS